MGHISSKSLCNLTRYRKKAFVKEILDVNKCIVIFQHNNRICNLKVKLDNVNKKNYFHDNLKGIEILSILVKEKNVYIECEGYDKKNNLLVRMFIENYYINKIMQNNGFT